jgi:hypothetical protein
MAFTAMKNLVNDRAEQQNQNQIRPLRKNGEPAATGAMGEQRVKEKNANSPASPGAGSAAPTGDDGTHSTTQGLAAPATLERWLL